MARVAGQGRRGLRRPWPCRSCGLFHSRKDLLLVKGNVIQAPTKTKTLQKQHDIQDKVGKSLNNPEK